MLATFPGLNHSVSLLACWRSWNILQRIFQQRERLRKMIG